MQQCPSAFQNGYKSVNCWFVRKIHDYGANEKMKKMLIRKNFQRKFDLASEILPHNPKQNRVKAKDLNITSRSSRLRSRTVANIIRNELQRLVDCGEFGGEIQSLNLTFTRANLSSHDKCQILWEPFLSTKDLEVADMLEKSASKFRHSLMTNLILNNVPELQFYMDAESRRIAMVDEILRSETLDIGDEPDDAVVSNLNEDATEKYEQAYGLDRDAMIRKLIPSTTDVERHGKG